jgi:hypothetical protein
MSHQLTVRFRVERYLPFRKVKSLRHSPIVARKTLGSKPRLFRAPLELMKVVCVLDSSRRLFSIDRSETWLDLLRIES